jgi:dTDP-4-dehydrorhamnose 3,5-epimerase
VPKMWAWTRTITWRRWLGVTIAATAGCGLAVFPYQSSSLATVRLDMQVSAGGRAELYINNRASSPVVVPLQPGVRRTYLFYFNRQDLKALRLDPTDAAAADGSIYGVDVVDRGETVAHFSPADLRGWNRTGVEIRDDPTSLRFTSINDDPIVQEASWRWWSSSARERTATSGIPFTATWQRRERHCRTSTSRAISMLPGARINVACTDDTGADRTEPTLLSGGLSIDDRGEVGYVNGFDFAGVRRFYTVRNHRAGFVRAWHAHRRESKYVTVVSGAAVVGAVRIDDWARPSRTLPAVRHVLSAAQPKVLFIPAGHANGFMSLTDDTRLIFFSTSTLDESKQDDVRYDARYWDIWTIEER